jgi:hypothetical protein
MSHTVNYKMRNFRAQQLSADSNIEANFPKLKKSIILLGASPSLLFLFLYCRAFNKGKDTRGFLFCKPKMHEVVASALQNSLSDF